MLTNEGPSYQPRAHRVTESHLGSQRAPQNDWKYHWVPLRAHRLIEPELSESTSIPLLGVRLLNLKHTHLRRAPSKATGGPRTLGPPVATPLYVVLLSSTASPAPAVIAVTAKIQIGPRTMIRQGVGEEVVWRRFYHQWTTDSDSAPQETPLSICRLTIGHCEVNRGQWPQVTLDDLETHVMQGQGSQLVLYWL